MILQSYSEKNMKNSTLKRNGILLAFYIVIALVFYQVGGEQLKYRVKNFIGGEPSGVLSEITENEMFSQKFTASTDILDSVNLLFSTFGRENKGTVTLELKSCQEDQSIETKKVDASQLMDNAIYEWQLDSQISDAKGQEYELVISSDCLSGEAPALYYRNLKSLSDFSINSEKMPYELYINLKGRDIIFFGTHYWALTAVFGIAIFAYLAWTEYQKRRGKITVISLAEGIWTRYEFLIQQLVSRDFKTKYKRSVLGYMWSFLNPLFTMVVQYVIFSTIFRSGIENFPVYLLSGIIMFNFFSEAVGQGLMAIVSNATLITKVYVPKYIYPVTKVVSCSINLLISIIPLLLVVLLTKTPLTKAILLLPFALLCLILFCVGMSMALSAAMVFFRDTQYLWGIFSMIWMYATPLFYPETIVPDKFKFIQIMNPMYHLIKFVRTILIEGISPDPIEYAYCLGFAALSCVLGAFIFKKTQDKFVLYV